MLLTSVILGLLANLSSANAVRRHSRCGAPEPSEEQIAAAQEFAQNEAMMSFEGAEPSSEIIPVNTYFHVVARSERVEDGYLTDESLADQLAVMNSDFAPSGFIFNLVNTTRTINPTWAVDSSELAMKRALRQGTYADLNVYFLYSLGGVLGYCYFPKTTPAPGTNDFALDGCTVLHTTLPGGTETRFDLGKTATHEIGHWMGLFHTFQGGCSGAGDQVEDTPAQSGPSSGCPVGRDSCPNAPGVDPITNYMDYSDDACYEEFTAGQTLRMLSSWTAFRLPGQ